HLRRVARAIGDTWLASRSLLCMIFAPAIFLVGVASMMAMMLVISLEMSSALAEIDGQGAQPVTPATHVPHIPSWAMFLPLIPMLAGVLWSLGILTTAWIRFIHRGRPVLFAPA